MGRWLDKSFAFYASYHDNTINKWIHIICVWPIFVTSLICAQYSPAVVNWRLNSPLMPAEHSANIAFIAAACYFLYYLVIEQPGIAGVIAAGLVYLGYCFAVNTVALYPLAWKPAAVVHVFCWLCQFYGHGVYEKRAPALLDNLIGAIVTAPLFVLMEVMFLFGYRREFQKEIRVLVDKEIKIFNDQKKK